MRFFFGWLWWAMRRTYALCWLVARRAWTRKPAENIASIEPKSQWKFLRSCYMAFIPHSSSLKFLVCRRTSKHNKFTWQEDIEKHLGLYSLVRFAPNTKLNTNHTPSTTRHHADWRHTRRCAFSQRPRIWRMNWTKAFGTRTWYGCGISPSLIKNNEWIHLFSWAPCFSVFPSSYSSPSLLRIRKHLHNHALGSGFSCGTENTVTFRAKLNWYCLLSVSWVPGQWKTWASWKEQTRAVFRLGWGREVSSKESRGQ